MTGFTPEAIYFLQNYHWPGNVRELENIIERAIVMTEGKKITEKDLPKSLTQGKPDEDKEAVFACSLADMEKRHIMAALKAAGGNKKKAIKILDISRPTLDKKIKKYGL
ncbi:MAG: helix-turn-helix domain-containing protein [bacterium]|nr:helix-turn-helix domain-containing protein [bacterium]